MLALAMLWAAQKETVLQMRQKRRVYRECVELIDEMPERIFIQCFRLNKSTFRVLCQDLRRKSNLKGTKELSLEAKVLCTLSFLATGSYQKIVGVSHNIAQRTVSRCITQVVEALNHRLMMAKWIKFPKIRHDRAIIKQKFQQKFGLPGVIGCIDCTHIAIVRPVDEEHLYFNRKGYHSLNVQMICDSDLYITNVYANFGGATHDSHIWSSSKVERYMRELHQNNEQVWLLGDSGYPQRPWLMTPVLNAVQGSREELYTQKHIQARNTIERCFGLLKARWRCLLRHRVLHYHPHIASKITMACCVLHNMAIKARIPLPPTVPTACEDDIVTMPVNEPTGNNQSEVIQGRAMLSSLINRL